jgi:hypothetical protein
MLLRLLIAAYAASGPAVLGLCDMIERPRNAKIVTKGIYREPERSNHSHFVEVSGLQWLSLMLLSPIPWAKRIWALPFLTMLFPSERYCEKRKRAQKKLTDWARRAILQVRRFLPGRKLVEVMDASYAAINFLSQVAHLPAAITPITRFYLDTALFTPTQKPKPGRIGRPHKKGHRLPSLEQVLEDRRTHWKNVIVRY